MNLFLFSKLGLASFLLFSAYMDEISSFSKDNPLKKVDIALPEVFVGGFLGSCLVYLFTSWACIAVGRSAQEVVNEVPFSRHSLHSSFLGPKAVR